MDRIKPPPGRRGLGIADRAEAGAPAGQPKENNHETTSTFASSGSRGPDRDRGWIPFRDAATRRHSELRRCPTRDFAPKLFDDPQVGKFFVGMSTDTRKSFRQKNKNLVCAATGGPCKIISRPAKVAHAGLGITESDFNVVAKHLADTLNKFNVPEKEQQELFTIIDSLKPDIVE